MMAIGLMLSVMSLFPVACYSGKVLVLHPAVSTTSHILAMRTLVDDLAARGHQGDTRGHWGTPDHKGTPGDTSVATASYMLVMRTLSNHLAIRVNQVKNIFIFPHNAVWDKGLSLFGIPPNGFITISEMCKTLFQQKDMIKHFRDTQFDVAIVDLMYNECSLMLAHNLGVPIVGFWAYIVNGVNGLYTQAFNPLAISPVMMSQLPRSMGFLQRVYNYVFATIGHAIIQIQFFVTESVAQTHLGHGPGPAAILANLSGMLINAQPPIIQPWLLPTNFIPVGGFHIREEKPLPKVLESWIDGSGMHGTVIFSLGSSFDPKSAPSRFIQKLLTAFGKLKQRVIMRYGGIPVSMNIPSNVKLLDWLPQRDILANPNVVLFVTHCGIFGVLEALHHGIPLVCMPIFGDQMENLQRLRELGLVVQFKKTSSADEIYNALIEGLSNPQYKEAADQMSSHLRSLPIPPLQQATWLLEHVMNTSGAHHYKIPAQHLNSLQYFGLDVVAFFLIIIFVMARLLYKCFVKLFLRNMNKGKLKES
ncbi:unnamed protein product, partial [Meganyctiphanes norvegica]